MGRTRATMLVLAVWALVGGPLVSAGSQPLTPTPPELPEAPAPYGLGSVALPADAAAIAAIFARMPRELAGEVKARWPAVYRSEDFFCATWGRDAQWPPHALTLCAENVVRRGTALDGWTASDEVAHRTLPLSTPPGSPVSPTVESFGRDGSLAWVQRTSVVTSASYVDGTPTPLPERLVYWLERATVDSPWLFQAEAWTPEEREALVRAFVAAAGATAATPPT